VKVIDDLAEGARIAARRSILVMTCVSPSRTKSSAFSNSARSPTAETCSENTFSHPAALRSRDTLREAIEQGHLILYQIYNAKTVKTVATDGFEVRRDLLDCHGRRDAKGVF
jgi:hypothetical protein